MVVVPFRSTAAMSTKKKQVAATKAAEKLRWKEVAPSARRREDCSRREVNVLPSLNEVKPVGEESTTSLIPGAKRVRRPDEPTGYVRVFLKFVCLFAMHVDDGYSVAVTTSPRFVPLSSAGPVAELGPMVAADVHFALLEKHSILTQECQRLRHDLELERKEWRTFLREAARYHAEWDKLEGEVRILGRRQDVSLQTKNMAISLIKELMEEKSNLRKVCDELRREGIDVLKQRHEDLRLAIAAQQDRLELESQLRAARVSIDHLKTQIDEIRRQGQAAKDTKAGLVVAAVLTM